MIRILFFDLATRSGYALGSVAGVEDSGIIEFPRTGDDFGTLALAMLDCFEGMLDKMAPSQVGFEQPIIPSLSKINLQTLRKLYLMGPMLEAAAIRRKVPCFEGALGDIRTHFLGRGNVPRDSPRAKAAVKNRCRDRGWKFQDDNEADALAGLDWALSCDSPAFALAGTALFGKGRP
jgi:hypothetical protein